MFAAYEFWRQAGLAALICAGATFAHAQAVIGTQALPEAPGTPSNVAGSVFDYAIIGGMLATNATNASFLRTTWTGSSLAAARVSGVDFSGARGLDGATTITVNGAPGVQGVDAVNVSEDGYFKPGLLCTGPALPCSNDAVAVGAPVVVRGAEAAVMRRSASGRYDVVERWPVRTPATELTAFGWESPRTHRLAIVTSTAPAHTAHLSILSLADAPTSTSH